MTFIQNSVNVGAMWRLSLVIAGVIVGIYLTLTFYYLRSAELGRLVLIAHPSTVGGGVHLKRDLHDIT